MTKKSQPSGNPPPDIEKRKTFRRQLPCALSPEELQSKGLAVALLIHEHTSVEEQKSEANKMFRERLETASEEIKELAGQISSKSEVRKVVCLAGLSSTNEWIVSRLDTGEVIEQRAATAEELTGNLFDEKDPDDEDDEDEKDPDDDQPGA